MKKGKIVFGAFIVFFLVAIYRVFFATSTELTDFSTLDPNDNKNIEVRALLAKDQPIQVESGGSSFSVKDKNNKLYKVQGPGEVPEYFHDANVVIMRGHLHHDYFHASSIVSIEM
jgi:cytochrome c-type biogenesis protein CcmE